MHVLFELYIFYEEVGHHCFMYLMRKFRSFERRCAADTRVLLISHSLLQSLHPCVLSDDFSETIFMKPCSLSIRK
jgi:hypothetical protein